MTAQGQVQPASTEVVAAAISRADLQRLLVGCVENLQLVYRENDGLFPYSSRLGGAPFRNDFRLPESIRYTVNTLLGLLEAARAGVPGMTVPEVEAMTARFLASHGGAIDNKADLGLLLLLLTELGTAADRAAETVERLRPAVEAGDPRPFNLQDLSWIIWGASAATREGLPGADALGRAAVQLLKRHFVHSRSGLPRHRTAWYRRNIVSFGGYAYFLRAMHEASLTYADPEAAALFRTGVGHALEIQGPLGEWPWMLGVRTGMPFDVYPVFSVHQDSMAMLFLLPALDTREPGVDEAIRRSLAWVFGVNELGIEFYRHDPFFAYRSIERADRAPRLRRYLRSLSTSVTRRPGAFGRAHVRLNDECRSYHLGWILYAWSSRIGPSTITQAG